MTTPSDPFETSPALSPEGSPEDTSPDPSADPFAEPAPVVVPPRNWLLAYRLLGFRLPAEYHPWLLRDAASKSFLTWRSLRTFVWGEVALWLVLLGRWITLEKWPDRVWLIRLHLVVVAVVLFSSRDALVRRVLRWHRIDKHGRPVEKVKPFARLSNVEALAFGVAVLVACVAGGAAYGDIQRPRGVAAAPCRVADPAVMDRIRAGQTNTKAKYVTTRMVVDGDTAIVIAITDLGEAETPKPSPTPQPSGTPRPAVLPEIWLVRADGIQRFGEDPKATTGFPAITQPDRKYNNAISRVASCLREKPVP